MAFEEEEKTSKHLSFQHPRTDFSVFSLWAVPNVLPVPRTSSEEQCKSSVRRRFQTWDVPPQHQTGHPRALGCLVMPPEKEKG